MIEKIKELCEKKGITIVELQQRIGLGKNSIYRWDSSLPSIDKVDKVAKELGVSIDEIYNGIVGETKEDVVESAFKRPEMRVLFSMCENAPKEDVEYVIKKLEKLKG